jgi:hypothetical protein
VLLDGDEWRAKLREFQSEAWRLETLPQYLVPQESEELEAFRSGERIDPHSYSSAYMEDLKRLIGEGRRKGGTWWPNRSPIICDSSSHGTTRLMFWPGKTSESSM